MAADQEFIIHPGRLGLNLRDNPVALQAEELSDSLNFRITARGSLVKRLGLSAYSSTDTSAGIIRIGYYSTAIQSDQIVAYCSDGSVQITADGASWETIKTGLATNVTPQFIQFLDRLYIANGQDPIQEWDGSVCVGLDTKTHAFSEAANWMTIWRNRLWAANSPTHPRRVWWSKGGTADDWEFTDNFIDFPDGGEITAIATSGSSPADQGATLMAQGVLGAGDGVLVFDEVSMHRIYNDADNTAGETLGGANILVDGGTGCVSQRSMGVGFGRLWLLARDGVYSTDGHQALRLESKLIQPLFREINMLEADGFFHRGSYLLAVTMSGSTTHNRLLELCVDLPANQEKQFPWMAHDLPLGSMIALSDGRLVAADARDASNQKLRVAFSGNSDVSDVDTENDIFCKARTAMMGFNTVGQKLLRRITCFGYGVFLISVISSSGGSEGGTFSMPVVLDTWNPAQTWGGVWGEGATGPVSSDLAKYTRTGRFLAFEVAERSQNSGPPQAILDQQSLTDEGGMKITAAQVTVTPLDVYA